MISDSDLNSFYTWCINTNIGIRRTKDKYRDILDIISTNLEVDKIGITVLNKVECLKSIIKVILKGNNIENAISNVINTTKFGNKENIDYLNRIQNEKITEEKFKHIIKNIENQIKVAAATNKIPDIEKLVDKLVAGDFEDGEESYDLIKKLSLDLSSSINKVERLIANNSESRVIIGEDSIIPTFERKLEKYRRANKIPTGFEYIDDKIMRGGFERSRLYIIAGNSASGKSTMLANMALNAAVYKNYVGDLKNKTKIFLYLTLENDKEESLERIMCSHWELSTLELDRKYMEDKEKVDENFTNDILENNSRIVVQQFNSKTISAMNIEVVIDDLIEKYGGSDKCMLAAVYVDYLDLLKSDGENKKDWQMLQEITQQLKNLAIDFEVPVVTATQLTRESYRVKNSWDLNVALIAESIGKVNIADFVAIMCKNLTDGSLVHFRVGKFRCGNPDVPLDFKVNFKHFKFLNCKPAESPKGKQVEVNKIPIDSSYKTSMNFPGCEI